MIRYIFTGEEERNENGRYIMPRDATHVSVHHSVTVIPVDLFSEHPNIVEVICHDGVIEIESFAFCGCPRLRRVIMRGVKMVELGVFNSCGALEYVECPELEIIGSQAFSSCTSLRDINLPSAKIVDYSAFECCDAMTDIKFGKELESVQGEAFYECSSLERITIPLKNGLFQRNDIFEKCENLKRVDLVEAEVLHETIAALLLEEWRDDMTELIECINYIPPAAPTGFYDYEDDYTMREKANEIRWWINCALNEIIHYKRKHRRSLSEAASVLQLALPKDIVVNHVVPFLELPSHTFDGETEEVNINSIVRD